MTPQKVCIVISLVVFILAALGVNLFGIAGLSLVALGLVFYAAGHL